MGHHEDRNAEAPLQAAQKLVERRRADRIQAGGRLVEKKNFRIERQGARETSAFAHAARQLHGIFRRRIRRQTDKTELERGDLLDHIERQIGVFEQGHLDILRHGQGRE